MPLLLDTGTALYHTGVRLAAPWSPKARAWCAGRKGLWERLEQRSAALQGCIWMHCASVGEFEQGRPVLEALKARYPDRPVLLTFFSPSGYEARKQEPLATHVEYLPPDGRANAERMQALVRPSMALFVKYEFWYHHLRTLQRHAVPTFLVSALFRADQPFFKWYGGAWRTMLRCFTAIGTQDQGSADLLAPLRLARVVVTGDTRYDRVLAIRAGATDLPLAAAFRSDRPTVVLGSSWPPDERLMLEALAGHRMKLIVVPHELGADHLAAIEERFPKPLLRWSELEAMDAGNVTDMLGPEEQATLLVDRMGLLSRLYRYGDVAYVGGGFTDGIHNLLEAAVWGRPVLFGPDHRKFPEAAGLIAAGGGAEVRNASDARAVLERWRDSETLADAAERAERFVAERAGATQRVMALITNSVE